MEEKIGIPSSVVTWIAFVSMIVSSFCAGYFVALNDAVPMYILWIVYGSAVLCGFNLNRLLVSARH